MSRVVTTSNRLTRKAPQPARVLDPTTLRTHSRESERRSSQVAHRTPRYECRRRPLWVAQASAITAARRAFSLTNVLTQRYALDRCNPTPTSDLVRVSALRRVQADVLVDLAPTVAMRHIRPDLTHHMRHYVGDPCRVDHGLFR